MNLAGTYTALVTPFDNGKVDYDALKNIISLQLEANVEGLVPVETTGESPTLTIDEHLKVIETVVKNVAGKCSVIAGTGANSTIEAVHLTSMAKKLGVDGTLQVTPYYNKPTPKGLYRHFSTIADECGLPIVLYNVPGRSAIPIPIDTVKKLSTNPNIVAIKEAAGSVDRVSAILNECDLTILSGDDALALPMIATGASGVISVASNIIPAEVKELIDYCNNGDFDNARRCHARLYPLFKDLFIITNNFW